MVYMSGGGVQIFSLMIVGQLIKGALGGMMNVNKSEWEMGSFSSLGGLDGGRGGVNNEYV